MFGYRVGDGPYNWLTYRSADRTIMNFRKGLMKIGVPGKPKNNFLDLIHK